MLVAGLTAAILSAAACATDFFGIVQRRLAGRWPAFGAASVDSPHCASECLLWAAVGLAAAYGHLAMDVFYSIGTNLPVWGVPLFWPFSSEAWAFPLVPWGDVGATLIFAASMFAMIRWPRWTQSIAAGSLIAVGVYMAVRGRLGAG